GQYGESRKFGDLLVSLGFITPEKLRWLLDVQEKYLEKQRAARGAAPSGGSADAGKGARTLTLNDVLTHAVKVSASDVHIHSGAPVQMRLGGRLLHTKTAAFDRAETERILLSALDD